MPIEFKILDIKYLENQLVIWYLVDDNHYKINENMKEITFFVANDGDELATYPLKKYAGSFLIGETSFDMKHLFYSTKKKE